jgi:NAD(P)-dependent dehydrogenase (short-subunit alcohol dehydrogenase family)
VGHFLLVSLLLPLLKSTTVKFKTNDARIVIATSSLHSLCRELNLHLLTSPTPTKSPYYDGIWRYGRSKLANILFTRELTRRLLADNETDPCSKDIFVNCFFPGNIATEQMDVWKEYLGRPGGWGLKKFFAVMGQSTQDGAAGALYLAASEEIVADEEGVRGEYFVPIATRAETSELAGDMEVAGGLWVSYLTLCIVEFIFGRRALGSYFANDVIFWAIGMDGEQDH